MTQWNFINIWYLVQEKQSFRIVFQNFLWSENLQDTSNEIEGRGPRNRPKLLPGWLPTVLLKVKTPFSWVAWKPQSTNVELIVNPSLVCWQGHSERNADFLQVGQLFFVVITWFNKSIWLMINKSVSEIIFLSTSSDSVDEIQLVK